MMPWATRPSALLDSCHVTLQHSNFVNDAMYTSETFVCIYIYIYMCVCSLVVRLLINIVHRGASGLHF